GADLVRVVIAHLRPEPDDAVLEELVEDAADQCRLGHAWELRFRCRLSYESIRRVSGDTGVFAHGKAVHSPVECRRRRGIETTRRRGLGFDTRASALLNRRTRYLWS